VKKESDKFERLTYRKLAFVLLWLLPFRHRRRETALWRLMWKS